MAISFQYQSISQLKIPKKSIKEWIKSQIILNGFKVGSVTYIFCNDTEILEINKQYLNHDYFTDIITFNYNENHLISGDIFISVDTVRSNAIEYGVSFNEELFRVIIHGVLHLIGFDDTTEQLQEIMTQKEDEALNNLHGNFLL